MPGTGKFSIGSLRAVGADVDTMARRVLTGMLSTSAWDAPAGAAAASTRCVPGSNCTFLLYQRVATSAAHVAVAREVAAAGAVLLKNDGRVLPLRRGASVLLLGSACSAPFVSASQADAQWDLGDYYSVGGSGRVIPAPEAQWTIEAGLRDASARGELGALTVESGDDVATALSAMTGHDVAIACGGAWSREGTDRESLQLEQHAFLVELGRARQAAAS